MGEVPLEDERGRIKRDALDTGRGGKWARGFTGNMGESAGDPESGGLSIGIPMAAGESDDNDNNNKKK